MRILVAFLIVLTPMHAAPRALHGWRDASQAEGRHYRVATNTFPEIAEELAATLDRSYALYEDRFGPLEGKARLPMEVRLYRTRDQYMEEGEGIAGALGHFDPSIDACMLIWSGSTGATGWPIAVHEGCHQYVRRRFGRIGLPSWYSEGIACWFEGLQTKATHDRVSRLRFAAAVAALRAGQARLDTVLDTQRLVQAGKLRVEGLTPARYYGLAWSLVHFLATDARYKKAFRRFELRLFAARPTRDGAVRIARHLLADECGSLEKLEGEWLAHIRGLRAPPILVAAPVYRWDLGSNHAFTRYAALRRIRNRPFARGLEDRVLACVDDSNVIVRTEAARLMARDPREGAARALTGSLDWDDAPLKKAALRALSHPTMEAAVPRLLRETVYREEAARALAAIRDRRSFPLLREAARNSSYSISTRARCLRALGGDGSARSLLSNALDSEHRELRSAARSSLRLLDSRGQEAAAQVEVSATPEPEPEPATTAIKGDARSLLLVAIDPTQERKDRIRACILLGALRSKIAVPELQRLCRAGVDAPVRLEALRTLVRITGETRGFEPGQGDREREQVFQRWAAG